MVLFIIIPLLILAPFFVSCFLNLLYSSHHPKPKLANSCLANSKALEKMDVAKEIKSGDRHHSKKVVELKQVFDTFDKNGDGFITKQELRESLKNVGFLMDEKEVDDMVERLDFNGDGLVDFSEFCEMSESKKARKGYREKGINEEEVEDAEEEDEAEEEELKEAFDVFDGDRNGLITVEELGLVLSSLGLKQGKRVEDCKEMIRKVDIDGDGMINFDEFKKMMKGSEEMLVSAF
ncbi:hypothetical protein Ancab_006842 [Ancistrocladus abbreviatus]